ncbi:MAG: hypothetical protein KJN73_10310 [Acidimicrobiia bacterium]|nr:hypothetical protein [Acidimicrobiia bacterium]
MTKQVSIAGGALLVMGFAMAACEPAAEPDEPLASLAWPEPSTRFTAEYWGKQAKSNSETWREAVDWCAEDTRKPLPNCQTVGQVRFIRTLKDSAGRRSEPYDGKSGVQMPPAVQEQLNESQTADNSRPPPGSEPVP